MLIVADIAGCNRNIYPMAYNIFLKADSKAHRHGQLCRYESTTCFALGFVILSYLSPTISHLCADLSVSLAVYRLFWEPLFSSSFVFVLFQLSKSIESYRKSDNVSTRPFDPRLRPQSEICNVRYVEFTASTLGIAPSC